MIGFIRFGISILGIFLLVFILIKIKKINKKLKENDDRRIDMKLEITRLVHLNIDDLQKEAVKLGIGTNLKLTEFVLRIRRDLSVLIGWKPEEK